MGDRIFYFVLMVICGTICGFVVLANVWLIYLRYTGDSVDAHLHFQGLHIGIPTGIAALALWRGLRQRA